jgi:hypothetical protein
MTEKIVDVKSMEYGSYSALVGLTQSGKLLIAQPTVELLMGWRENSGREKIVSKSLKTFAGKDFKVGKTTHSVSWVGQGKTVFYDYPDFLIIVRWQAGQGNIQAIDLLVAGFADSFSDFAYKLFGISLTDKERQATIKQRILGKVKRRELTDAVKDYIIRHNKSADYQKWIYPNITDTINLGIFNRRASQLKEDWDTKNPRDSMTEIELDYVKQVEDLISRLIDQDDIEPMRAVIEALTRLIIPVCDR